VDNTSTGRRDTVQIKYIAQNNDVSLSHNVGLRIMMDIDIAGIDDAPIRVPGIGIVKNELELNEDNVPSYWQAFDSPTNPSVIAQGTLIKNEAGRPNKVQFVNFSSISMSSNQWGYTVDTSKQIGDSALDITWNENILAPGQTKEYVTYCGLSEFTQDLTTPLAVSLVGDSKIESDVSGYSPNPFTITSYITNIGNTNATNVKARIILPAGLTLANSQEAEVNLGTCLVQEEKQASWKVDITPSTTERTLTYSLNVWADNIQSKTINKTIYIPALVTSSDPLIGEWVGRTNMTTTRYGNTVSVVNGKIYSIGGAPVIGSVTNVNEEYDPLTDSWTSRTSMPTARSFSGSAVVNGKIYVIGGWNGNSQPYSKVEEYDPVTDTWVTKANMPTARYGFSTAVVNNKIYIMGGCIGNYYNGADEAIIEVYDPATNTWQQKANMPIARSGAGAAVYNDKIYVMGGRSNNIFSKVGYAHNPITKP